MTTATRPLRDAFAAYQPLPRVTGPIVVATDTSRHSDAAFPIASALAERTNAMVHVVSAMMPFAMPMYPFDAMSMPPMDEAAQLGREGMVKAQRARLVPPASAWPVTVRIGEPAREIVTFAQSLHASVIVVGRGRHTALQRALSGETVLRLLQLGDTPVLATESKLSGLPKRVVIATDFSEFSVRAAQVAMSLVAPEAHVYLVHVMPHMSDADSGLKERAVAYRNQAVHAFSQLRARFGSDGMKYEDVLAEGDPSEELIRVVHATGADLVVTATHGYGFLRRMILGSVAAELVRHAPCSVLCVPGTARTLLDTRAHPTTRIVTHPFDPAVFDAELSAFSVRNAGRRSTIEVDHPDLGAQVLGHSLPLVGASHDHSTGIVSLMFGAPEFAGEHITHAIADVSAIDLSTDGTGRDKALRLIHPLGQTLLLLE